MQNRLTRMITGFSVGLVAAAFTVASGINGIPPAAPPEQPDFGNSFYQQPAVIKASKMRAIVRPQLATLRQ